AMLGRAGRFVVLGLAAVAALGYGITALFAATAPGATGWPIIAAVAARIPVIGTIWVAPASAGGAAANRSARPAEAPQGELDAAATWDALSRGEDIVDDAGSDPGDGDDGADAETAADQAADADDAAEPDPDADADPDSK